MIGMDLYREEILEHWRNPQNFGELEKPDLVIEQVNSLCGDEVTFYFRLGNRKQETRDTKQVTSNTKRKRVTSAELHVMDVRFTGSGCAISMASASMLSEAIKGKSAKQIEKITGQDVLGLIGGEVAPARLKCAFLALEALRKLPSSSLRASRVNL